MLKLMDNKDQNLQNQPVSPSQPRSTDQAQLSQNDKAGLSPNPQRQVMLSANSLDLANPSNKSKKVVLFVATGVILLAVVAGLFIVFQKPGSTTKNNTNNSSKALNSKTQNSKTQTDNNETLNPTNNPLNDNGTINSQVKYCSNALNAEFIC